MADKKTVDETYSMRFSSLSSVYVALIRHGKQQDSQRDRFGHIGMSNLSIRSDFQAARVGFWEGKVKSDGSGSGFVDL